jgi:hypothetical protein
VCVGQTGHAIETRYNELAWRIGLYEPDKLVVIEHQIHFKNTTVLARMTGCMGCVT